MTLASDSQGQIVSTADFTPAGFTWLRLKRLVFKDGNDRPHTWEAVERANRVAEVDGVGVMARVSYASRPPEVVLIAQYRPAVGGIVLELPGGLVDAGEKYEQTALRELKEETGYVGRVVAFSPIIYSEPGLTNSNMKIAMVEIDGDAEVNQKLQPSLQAGEMISVHLLPLHSLLIAATKLAEEHGWRLDAKVAMLGAGLTLGATSGTPQPPVTSPPPPPPQQQQQQQQQSEDVKNAATNGHCSTVKADDNSNQVSTSKKGTAPPTRGKATATSIVASTSAPVEPLVPQQGFAKAPAGMNGMKRLRRARVVVEGQDEDNDDDDDDDDDYEPSYDGDDDDEAAYYATLREVLGLEEGDMDPEEMEAMMEAFIDPDTGLPVDMGFFGENSSDDDESWETDDGMEMEGVMAELANAIEFQRQGALEAAGLTPDSQGVTSTSPWTRMYHSARADPAPLLCAFVLGCSAVGLVLLGQRARWSFTT